MRGGTRLSVVPLAAMLLGLPGAVAAGAEDTPTFTKDVAPIFQQKCQACHRPGYIAPMSARDLRGIAALGAVDQDPASRRARCRRGTSTSRSASRTSRTIAR